MNACRALSALALAGLCPVAGHTQALPDGNALEATRVAAMGGRVAMDNHSSLHVTGILSPVVTSGGGQTFTASGTWDTYASKSNRFIHTTSGIRSKAGSYSSEESSGFDGTTAWLAQPGGKYLILEGETAEQVLSQTDFFAEILSPVRYAAAQTMTLEDFEGRKCYKVKLVKTSGAESFRYFDAETGLAAGSMMTMKNPLGDQTSTWVMSDYKDYGGIRMPSRLVRKQQVGDIPVVATMLVSYQWDNVDPSVFKLPDGVKALINP